MTTSDGVSSPPRDTAVFGALGFLAFGFAAAYWSTLGDLIRLWTSDDDYSYGLLIGPVTAYLIWRRFRQEGEVAAPRGQASGIVIVLACGLVGLTGVFSGFRTLTNLALVGTVWGGFVFLFGAGAARRYAWELFLLIFLVPIPAGLYAEITMPLQLFVTRSVTVLLHAVGVPALREGNVLQLARTTLEVVNACSGLRSLLTVCVLAYVLGCLSLNEAWGRLVLLASALPVAMATNVLRVFAMAVGTHSGHAFVLEGVGHTALGIAVFLGNLGMLVLIAKGITWLSPRRR